ncbi:peroxisomal fatty acid beta-oxidation multifunctional protein [Panicum miliaceum]|uniref:Peroxisomal fatty acid beta-oxidation multifunctional protein n=1 Tax=Panicum miliaceum TaxID=4540 RepID=A0A3L6RP87_PANMI|nr:peroxisomal fatty acid beta-oxidation multifunctional protein [Panicum miliaceum]
MAAGPIRVTMEVGADGVALITIANPPVNALHPIIIAGLKDKYAEAARRDDIKAIVLTGAGGKFCGGFDINVFTKVHQTGDVSLMPDVSVELVSNMMEEGKKPSVSAIQGLALGGGLELAMGCHARISTPEAQLGLPELTLGIFPGFGGTQRLPRLVGLPKAIEMMLQSKFITAKEGKERGLIDALCSPDELIKMSRLWALEIANCQKPWIRSLGRTDRLGSLSEARAVLSAARQQAKKIAPNMPQHQACLDVIEEGILYGGHAGVLKEAKVFKELVVAPTSRALVHVFFAQRSTTKVPGVTDVQLKPRQIRKVAVIGGGLMGSGIATALLVSNISVVLKEVNPQFLQRGEKMIAGNLEGLVKRGSLTKDKMNKAMSLLKGALDYSDFKDVDMVIEAVIEKIPLKQSIFADIERICPKHCILATNTSTIDLNVVGEKTSSQDRIIGAHFFSPAHIMPLLEIVRTEKTSPQAILDLITVGKIIKKVPVVVGNCTGFAVNRTFFPYTQGSHLLVSLGIDVFRIDRVISNFGMPMGPFQLQDVAGYGVALAVKDIYAKAFGERNLDSDLVDLMVKDGRQGKMNGKGYYIYEKGGKPKPDPSVQRVIEEYRKRAKTMPGGKPVTLTDQDILEMIFFPVVNEACRVMDENVVIRASDLDIASVLGMGFPKYRGGIVFWADTVGAPYIYSKLSKWAELYGPYFKPSPYLEQRAKSGVPLSAPSASQQGSARSRM